VENELLAKIVRILEIREPTESDVHHLFGLARKLIERLPREEKKNFALLAFYSSWTVHPQIDRSTEGAMVVERMNSIVNSHMKRDDASVMPRELTAALSLDETEIQFRNLIRLFDAGPTFSILRWRPIAFQLIEIISNCPLKIDSTRRQLRGIRERIEASPIKDRTVVEQVAIVKVPSTILYPNAAQNDFTFCTELTLSNTTRIIAPIQLA
jgi:hypothetical protein